MRQFHRLLREIKWRIFASATWTWLLTFPVIGCFLFLWMFSPVEHIFDLYDYFTVLFILSSWIKTGCIAFLCTLLIKCHMENYEVTCCMAVTRIRLFLQYFQPRMLAYALFHSCAYGFIIKMFASISNDSFSEMIIDCDDPAGTYRCVNESCFILTLFGVILGFYNYVVCKANYKYILHFSSTQLGRFHSVKCNFASILSNSAKVCIQFMKYFLFLYFILGFSSRRLLTALSGYTFCDGRLMSFNSWFCIITLVWTLWIAGFLLLVIHGLSWHLFNIYVTQIFAFPVETIFPEDEDKLLPANLNKNRPLLVQHLAFHYLSIMSKHSKKKRQQLFEVNYETSGKRSLKWDIVADECLSRINELTKKLKDYHQSISMSECNARREQAQPTSPTSFRYFGAGRSLSREPTPLQRRRPLHQIINSQSVNSNLEASSLNASTVDYQNPISSSAFLNGSAITVPTPKLWTRGVKNVNFNSSVTTAYVSSAQVVDESQMISGYETSSAPAEQKAGLHKLPLVVFFTKQIPSRVAANIFSEHNIYKWAVESISFLVAASLTEDQCGFVQKRLDAIISSLIELLMVLEKNCKLTVTSSDEDVQFLLRQQHNLKADTKSAIYRITDAFAKHVDSFSVSAEHKRKLRSFVEHRE